MNTSSLKSLILAGAVTLGLSSAFAATDPDQVSAPASWRETGLLGKTYGNFEVSFVDLDDTGIDAKNFHFGLNQAVRAGLDSQFDVNHIRTDSFAGTRLSQYGLTAGLRAYTTSYGVKPFAEAGLGWAWMKGPFNARENSWTYYAGIGAEMVIGEAFSLTPYIRFSDAPEAGDTDVFNFGARGNYWLNEKLALTAIVDRDDDQNTAFTFGVNYRY
jgi:hypothetical protein